MNNSRYAIHVTNTTTDVGAQSNREAERYMFAYTITIENTGEIGAQLIDCHWQ